MYSTCHYATSSPHFLSVRSACPGLTTFLRPRPHLLPLLYQALGLPCTQCGRRFMGDDEGKKKKTAHMDWHFRVHQRMIEAEKRGQHRSWYVDQAVSPPLLLTSS